MQILSPFNFFIFLVKKMHYFSIGNFSSCLKNHNKKVFMLGALSNVFLIAYLIVNQTTYKS